MSRKALVTALFCIGFITGCGGETGPERAEVEGEVTFDGQPVELGTISFESQDAKGSSAGGTIKDGRYHIPADKGPTIGRFKVKIVASRKTGRMIPMGAGLGAEKGAEVQDEVVYYIPREYNSATTLSVEIASGSNNHDFQLEPGRSRNRRR